MQDGTRPRWSIERQWIEANVLGAACNAAGGVLVYGVAKLFAADSAETGVAVMIVFSVVAIAVTAVAISLYGFLLAVVLRQKVPRFPMQHWMALYLLFGIALGALTAYTSTFPDDVNSPAAADDAVRGIVIGAAVSGALFGFLMGAVQAAMLRDVAHGLSVWVRFSALAGTALAILVAVSVTWPQTGFANEIQSELATFVASVVAAFIMLPAVSQLERI